MYVIVKGVCGGGGEGGGAVVVINKQIIQCSLHAICKINPFNAEIYLNKPWRPKVFFSI